MAKKHDYGHMTPEQIREAVEEKAQTASKDAQEADEGWSDNVEWIEK